MHAPERDLHPPLPFLAGGLIQINKCRHRWA
jgi:hypothetical protein